MSGLPRSRRQWWCRLKPPPARRHLRRHRQPLRRLSRRHHPWSPKQPHPRRAGETPPAASGADTAIDALTSVPPETPPIADDLAALNDPAVPAGPTPLLMDDGTPGNLAQVPTVEDPVLKLVRLGRGDLAAQRYSTPPNQNAVDRFKLALRIDARDKGAKQGHGRHRQGLHHARQQGAVARRSCRHEDEFRQGA